METRQYVSRLIFPEIPLPPCLTSRKSQVLASFSQGRNIMAKASLPPCCKSRAHGRISSHRKHSCLEHRDGEEASLSHEAFPQAGDRAGRSPGPTQSEGGCVWPPKRRACTMSQPCLKGRCGRDRAPEFQPKPFPEVEFPTFPHIQSGVLKTKKIIFIYRK